MAQVNAETTKENAILQKFAMPKHREPTLSPVEVYGRQLKDVRTIRRDPVEEAENELKRRKEKHAMMKAALAEEEVKRQVAMEKEHLRFVQKRFKKDKLPWQRTISSDVFRHEILKEFGNFHVKNKVLIDKVQSSNDNVKLIQSGKNLKEVFADGREGLNLSFGSPTSAASDVLPVFNSKTYTDNLSKLVGSKELERCFDLSSNKQYANMYNALVAFEKSWFQTDEYLMLQKNKEMKKSQKMSDTGMTFSQANQTFALTGVPMSTIPVGTPRRTNGTPFNASPNQGTPGKQKTQVSPQKLQVKLESPKSGSKRRKKPEEEETQESYLELNSKLKFPSNPAYFN